MTMTFYKFAMIF